MLGRIQKMFIKPAIILIIVVYQRAQDGPKYGLHYMIHEQYTIARIQIPWGDRQS